VQLIDQHQPLLPRFREMPPDLDAHINVEPREMQRTTQPLGGTCAEFIQDFREHELATTAYLSLRFTMTHHGEPGAPTRP